MAAHPYNLLEPSWKNRYVSRGDGQLQWGSRSAFDPFFPTPKNWNSTTELSHANKTLLQICGLISSNSHFLKLQEPK